jgi:hypothetical protein
MLDPIPQLLSDEENYHLCKIISKEEVWNVIKSLNPNKSPGPDEFSTSFYQN